MHGQMLKLERKSIEAMASNLEGGNVQAMQQFLSDSRWDDTAVIHVHQQEAAKTLGHKDGALIVEIPRNTVIWQQCAPRKYASKRVDELAATLDARHWRRVVVHEGTKGPIISEIAILRQVFSEQALPAREDMKSAAGAVGIII